MRRFLGIAIIAALGFYLGFFALAGERGWLSLRELEAERAAARAELATLVARRQALEERVARLRPGRVDPDMLDLQARRILGRGHPRDVVLPRSEGAKSAP